MKAGSRGEVAQHTEALDLVDKENRAVAQRKFTFLSGEIPRRKCLGKSVAAIVALKLV